MSDDLRIEWIVEKRMQFSYDAKLWIYVSHKHLNSHPIGSDTLIEVFEEKEEIDFIFIPNFIIIIEFERAMASAHQIDLDIYYPIEFFIWFKYLLSHHHRSRIRMSSSLASFS